MLSPERGKSIPKSLERAIGYNIDRLSSMFRRHLVWALRDYDLTPEQWQVLATLVELKEPVSQMQLSEVTLRDRHTISRMLDRMEERDWIVRKPDPDDKRAFLVSPSRKAVRDFPSIQRDLHKAFDSVLKTLSENETETMLRLMKKLMSAFA